MTSHSVILADYFSCRIGFPSIKSILSCIRNIPTFVILFYQASKSKILEAGYGILAWCKGIQLVLYD